MSEAMLIGGEQTDESSADDGTDGLGQEASEASGTDFVDRIMTDRDFAEEQFLKREKTISRLGNEIKELEPITTLVKAAGGTDQLMRLMTLGNQVLQTPGLHDVAQSAISAGRYEPPTLGAQDGQKEEDAWVDPEFEPYVERINAQEQRIAELTQRLESFGAEAQTAGLYAKQGQVKNNIEAVLADFKGNPEVFGRAQKMLTDAYENSFQRAEAGDESQAKLVDRIATAEGVGILDGVLAPLYKELALKGSTGAKTESESNVVDLRKATDERVNTPARTGPPTLPTPPRGTRPNASDFRKVMEAAARNMGMNPNS